MAESRLAEVAARGQSIWIDLLSREFVHSGELKRLVDEDSVTGLTSNPSIFQKAIAGGGDYDDQIRESLEETDDPREIFLRLAVDDVRDACDVLRPVWDATGGADGYVSLEVDPGLAHDERGTVEQAVDLHGRVDRPNVYIKIPATVEGLPAIEDCIARGISINVTLIFSVQRYRHVVAAYQRGLARLHRRRRRALEGHLGRLVLRLAPRHRGRRAARCARQHRARGPARCRQREARLQGLPGALRRACLGDAGGGGCLEAAAALGVDLDEEPGLPGRDVRRGADRPGHREHDAARDARGVRRPRRGSRRHGRSRAWRRRSS